MRNLSIAAVFCAVCSGAASGQTAQPADETAILAVVDRFMLAVSSNDAETIAKLCLENTSNIIERPAEGGGTRITRRVLTPESFRSGNYRERYWDPVVHVRGRLAVVWTPYEFWKDGKTSHCGVDVFEMVKEDGAWRIANTMWTVEPGACASLRPRDPRRIRPAP